MSQISLLSPAHRADKATALALGLARAESKLEEFTSGQVDAIVDPDGRTHLLRPAQEYLRQSEGRLQGVIESVADGITVVNRAGVVLFQSHAGGRVLGYEPGELVGGNLFGEIHPDDGWAVYSSLFNVIDGFIENATVEFRHRARDRSYRMIEATVGRVRDSSFEKSAVFSLRALTGLVKRRAVMAWTAERHLPGAGGVPDEPAPDPEQSIDAKREDL